MKGLMGSLVSNQDEDGMEWECALHESRLFRGVWTEDWAQTVQVQRLQY